MINRHGIYHKPLSEYAFALNENTLIIRIKTARNNIDAVMLHFGDTAYRGNPVQFTTTKMNLVASDNYFDYFEARIDDPYQRIIYYFELINTNETLYYYADAFYPTVSHERNDLYKFPYMRKEDIITPPLWLKDAIIYNIFPDSFTTNKTPINQTKIVNSIPVKNRLGGTLRNIIQALDYIQDLGINTLYLNPIFTAGEYHKYDVIDYYSIDPMLGTNDEFKELVNTCHTRNMRIIIDGVFNHAGWNFFAFLDVLKHQEKSEYVDWFYHLDFPIKKPQNHSDMPRYACFGYERHMPKINTSNPDVIQYFTDVCAYWINEFDIDGWRLDVADEVDTNFWRMFTQTARSCKQDVAIIGEVWQDASYYLDGTMFDSTMNYDFIKYAKAFFGYETIAAKAFDGHMAHVRYRYREQTTYTQLNILDSHDVPRFLSHCQLDINRYKLAVIYLLTSVGTPSILYGDEQALDGIKEHDYRQSMVYDHNNTLYHFFKTIIHLRKNHKVLRSGFYKTIQADSNSGYYEYERYNHQSSIRIILNKNNYSIPLKMKDTQYVTLAKEHTDNNVLGPYGYIIYKYERMDGNGNYN